MKDWLGNSLEIDDLVVYTSKSTNIGMVLGKLTFVDRNTIKLKALAYSAGSATNKIIVLHKGDSAFSAVTRYFGEYVG